MRGNPRLTEIPLSEIPWVVDRAGDEGLDRDLPRRVVTSPYDLGPPSEREEERVNRCLRGDER